MRLTIETWSDNPILRDEAQEVKNSELHALRPLVAAMLDFVKNPKNGGIGLAAPQVGLSKQIIVVGLPQQREDTSYPIIPMLNPCIVRLSSEKDRDEEWCLSLPGQKGIVERSVSIDVVWMDIKGKKIRKTFTGFAARVIQHEVDHLHGVLITDKFL